MPRFRRQNRLGGFGLVDSLVGILILVLVAASVAGAFTTLSRLDHLQSQRIDKLFRQSDAASHSDWY